MPKGKLLHIAFKANPAYAVIRSSVLMSFKLNLFGVSTRIYPAFLTQQQLMSGGFDLQNAERAKAGWIKAQDIWFKIGGNPDVLKRQIIIGAKHRITRLKKKEKRLNTKQGFDGEYFAVAGADDIAVGSYILAGLPVVTAIINAMTKSGAKKNPYATGKTPSGFVEVPDPTDSPSYDVDKRKNTDPETGKESSPKILGIPEVPFIIGATVVAGLLVWGGIYLYNKSNPVQSPLVT